MNFDGGGQDVGAGVADALAGNELAEDVERLRVVARKGGTAEVGDEAVAAALLDACKGLVHAHEPLQTPGLCLQLGLVG